MLYEMFGVLAAVAAVVQAFPYVASILRGTTRPSRTSFGIWTVVTAVAAGSYIASGARTTIWAGVVYTATALLTFLLSLRRGTGGLGPVDIACSAVAFIAVGGWLVTSSSLVALYASTSALLIGFVPTVLKAWHRPTTENLTSWAIASLSSVLNMLALTSLSVHIVIAPLAALLGDGAVTVVLTAGRLRHVGGRVQPAAGTMPGDGTMPDVQSQHKSWSYATEVGRSRTVQLQTADVVEPM